MTRGVAAKLVCSCYKWVFRIMFLVIFTLCTLPPWVYTLFTDVCGCTPTTAEGMRRRGRFVANLTGSLWYMALRLCCWLEVDSQGLAPLNGAGRGFRSVFIAVNHTSFMDTPLVCAMMPRRLAGDTKTLAARVHLKLPILGRLASVVGHLPVPYTSRRVGDFTLDKEQMAKTMAKVDEHIWAGGHLAIFPEGDLNKDWHVLKQFRRGGMEICIRHDMEVWGWITVGPAISWPADVFLGGTPAKLRNRAFLICISAKEAAERLAGPGSTLQEQAQALAAEARAAMQKVLDEMLASSRSDGWPEEPELCGEDRSLSPGSHAVFRGSHGVPQTP